MIQPASVLIQNDHYPAYSRSNAFQKHASTLLEEPQVYHLEDGKEWHPTFALFLETKIQLQKYSQTLSYLFSSFLYVCSTVAENKGQDEIIKINNTLQMSFIEG